jgi:hypothetical protein
MLVLVAVAVPAFWTSAHARARVRGSSRSCAAATSTVTRPAYRPADGTEGEPDVPQKVPPVVGRSTYAPPVEGPTDMSVLTLLQWASRIWMARYLGMR